MSRLRTCPDHRDTIFNHFKQGLNATFKRIVSDDCAFYQTCARQTKDDDLFHILLDEAGRKSLVVNIFRIGVSERELRS